MRFRDESSGGINFCDESSVGARFREESSGKSNILEEPGKVEAVSVAITTNSNSNGKDVKVLPSEIVGPYWVLVNLALN